MEKIRSGLVFLLFFFLLSSVAALDIDVSLSLTGETCYDGLKNQNETGIDCGGPCAPCYSPPQKTGGGGGTANINLSKPAYINQTEGEKEEHPSTKISNITVAILPANLTQILTADDFIVYAIEIRAKNHLSNFTLFIENISLRGTENALEDELIHFKLSATNLDLNEVEMLKIYYKIPLSWIREKNSTYSEFTLYHFSGEWVKKESLFAGEDGEYQYYSSKIEYLGFYSIAGKKIVAAIIPKKEKTPLIEIPWLELKSDRLVFLAVASSILFFLGAFNLYKKVKEARKIKDSP